MMQDTNAELSWTQPKCVGDVPDKRSGHTFTIVGSNGYLFGGCSISGKSGPTNTMYMLKMSSGEFEWVKLKIDGELPLARWKHTATQIDGTKIIVFGGFHSNTNRLNDVWIFDTITLTWSAPIGIHCDFTPRGNHVPKKGAWSGVPCPRGGHSASLIDNSLYIFGGYGGFGYGRRDFNDIHALDLEDFTWQKLGPKGKAPEARSGHIACVIQRKVYIFGGWNSIRQFNDLHVFDTETLQWTNTETKWGEPRWNHTACSVEAIPNWKMFIFGGCTGNLTEDKRVQGKYSNDVVVLDTGFNSWNIPDIVGKAPAPRADTEISYDAESSRLVLFGGWANKWFGDVHTLDVSCVVGPPYAIVDIQPKMGAITGGTKCIITGIDFVNTTAVVVRFSSRKGFMDVQGKYISPTEIQCDAPNFEKFNPGEVDVRVSLRGDSFTTTFQRFKYFAVTDATLSLAYGPGILDGGAVGTPTVFVVQAKDTAGRDRSSGNDEWEINILSEDGTSCPVRIDDHNDGKYMISTNIPKAGIYTVSVEFNGTFGGNAGHIRGSPFTVNFKDQVTKDYNTMHGPLVMESLKNDIKELQEFTKDTALGLKAKIPEDSVKDVIKVIEHLHSITDRKDELGLTIDRARAVIGHLEAHGNPVGKLNDHLESSVKLWEEVQKQVPTVKASIAPLVKIHGAKTKIEATEYAEEVDAYVKAFKSLPFWTFATGVESARTALGEAKAEHMEAMTKNEQFNHLATMLEFPEYLEDTNKLMNSVEQDLEHMRELWLVAGECFNFISSQRELLWTHVDVDVMEEQTKKIQKTVKHLDKAVRWSNSYLGLDKCVKDFLNTCPLIMSLHHPSMRPRHWDLLMKATEKTFTPPHANPQLKMGQILSLNLHEYTADVEEIADQAQKEEKMENQLKKLNEQWKEVEWLVEPTSDEGVNILKMTEEDHEMLENDQLVVQGMLSSRFLATFESEVNSWHSKLAMVAEVVQILNEIQHTWSYLEPLFIKSDEVKRELPEDAARFQQIDVDVKAILSMAEKQKVIVVCNQGGLFDRLEKIQELLDICKKSLADFLAGKRRQFPRFYFVSEADLLDMLSNGAHPATILHHISKVFLATNTLKVTEQEGDVRPDALKWISGVGMEEVSFEPPVTLDGKVEIYLQTVLDAMVTTLQAKLKKSFERYPTQSRADWLMHRDSEGSPVDPAQIAILVSGIMFTHEVELTLKKFASGHKDALEEFGAKQAAQLNDLIKLTRTKLNKGDRTRAMVMITMDAHCRDVLTKFKHLGVDDKDHFAWQSQLKQRYSESCSQIDICDASFDYGFEYLGNGARLVVTPLTDRIYVTATQALNLKMGCAPAGPAGTGKTETTKDLASALGKVCYVFNCSPEMDYKSLGNIFQGLAASGSWGCFDEFNRLVPEVLSVCTVQFKAVLDAIRQNQDTVVVEGDEVKLDRTCGAFITMNPGYLGRSELPQGLKALFRPITVMVPDLVLICENMLMAEGFENAKILATKFYGLYSLLRDLLSKQLHYDWGLRAVKSVLVVAGGFKRAEPDKTEEEILCRALRDFNTPKIVKQDEVVFFGLLGDLFPGVDPPRAIDETLEGAVRDAAVQKDLWPDDKFCLKVVQLEELLEIRHCVFVIGAAGCGKSETWKTLAKARSVMGRKQTVKDLNPKAISPEELYGYVNMATRVWKDGLLSNIMRSLGQIPNSDPKWIILDGDLDANWIESMNSVMDDNKMLTLASNERIPLKPHMRMIFEIRDLNYASPATVSRAGILFIPTEEGTQWRNIIASWVRRRTEPEVFCEALTQLFDKYVEPTLIYLKKYARPLVQLEDVAMVTNLLHNLEALLPSREQSPEERNQPVSEILARLTATNEDDDDGEDEAPVKEKKLTNEELRHIEQLFVFAAVWAFGSTLSEKDGENYRQKFSEWWKGEFKGAKLPSRETVFDVWLDPRVNKFDLWKNSPYFYTIEFDSKTTDMQQVTVPTPETCSIHFWMSSHVEKKLPVMLVGNAGVGKTQLVHGLLTGQDPAARVSKIINFNFYTNSVSLQSALEQPLEKKAGANFGPPGKSSMVFFVDDLNLPEVDDYGTQSAIALLRQHMDYEHWYDRNKLVAKNILNCQYVACMNPTAGSFMINPRLQRHFITFAIGFPGATSLLTIYQTFLDGHLKNFSTDIQALSSNLINAALGLHQSVTQTFRKTAKNFHYEFNIRHLSNVFQGLLVAQPTELKSSESFVRLWLHESERVYGDRLVSNEDLGKYKNLALAQAKKRFPQFNVANYFAAENSTPLIFCHFADSVQDKVYDQSEDMEKLSGILNGALEEYNETNATMDLVLFLDAMRHVCRIARIILNPGGNALLVGVGGSGKQSLSRLAAFICEYSVFQIVISANYSLNDLKDDFKVMYQRAGLKQEGMVFLFTDSQITNERFLVYINDLLASGDIPDLYTPEEIDGIVNGVTSKVKAAGLIPEKKTCWKFFLEQVKKNLHVVLCFSPVGDDFRSRSLRFPALVSCTSIDWFQPWPEDALVSVGKKFLADMDLGSEEVREGVEKFMPFSFKTVNDAAKKFFEVEQRYCYTTPKSYLELLKQYKELLDSKRDQMAKSISRLSNGLTKLKETGEVVSSIEEDLKVLLVEAEEKKAAAEVLAEQVAKEKAIVETETSLANEEAEKCAVMQADVATRQKDTQEDLDKAEPMVEAAMAALDTLNKKDLGECRTMAKPPAGVDDVFSAVMVLLAGIVPTVVTTKAGKVKDRSWEASKKALLSNVNEFLRVLSEEFKNYVDDNKVNDINWKEVRPYLAKEHFTVEIISKKNSAAAGLCSWVLNIVAYRDVLVTVEPKRQALREATTQLEAANSKLKEVREKVADLEAKLAELTEKFDEAEASKQQAINTLNKAQKRLDLAQRLTRALADENVRWAENVEELKANSGVLVGDTLLASAFISYIGPFTKPFRDELITQQWVPFLRKAANGEPIPMSEDCNPLSILTTEAQIAQWNSQKLPADRVSIENGAVVCNSARWPLILDPQLQGIAWLMEKESGRELSVVRLGQKGMVRKLGFAIENGTSVLIENMGERIDAVLNPIIQRATIKKGHKKYVKLGEEELEWHKDFRLFLHTKLRNPHYPPEIQAETTLVNFTVTENGLEDQLLAMVVYKERPDLAERRTQLIQQANEFKIKIRELEDGILEKLATAEGDITEDVELIESLENTKIISVDVKKKMIITERMSALIQASSEKYRSVAARGSLLFFLMNSLAKVHTYYKFSLNAFVTVFLRGIDLVSSDEEKDALKEAGREHAEELEAAKSKEVPIEGEEDDEEEKLDPGPNDEVLGKRCVTLVDSTQETVFKYIRRGLFEKDKLMVASQLCLKVQVAEKILTPRAVSYLVLSRISEEPGSMGGLSDWMPENIWCKIKSLEDIGDIYPEFETLGEDMQQDCDEWFVWFNKETPESFPCPSKLKDLGEFERLLLLRAMRPDRLPSALTTWVANFMGKVYTNQEPFSMAKTHAESSPTTPIFFVLFPGVDPTTDVEQLGAKLGFTIKNGKLLNISMGQGQEAPAEAAVERFAKTGGWIMLQNVHLMQSWLPILERKLEQFSAEAHPDFRCFISAEPPPFSYMNNMPESLLQICIKVANEAPADLKSNLRYAWGCFNEDRLVNNSRPFEFRNCLFTLCFFHALVLGRRRFGQQGWSRGYSFNTGDLNICADVMESYLNDAPEGTVPWDDLRYIIGEIMYGGHITDPWDRRTNSTYLEVLLQEGIFKNGDLASGFQCPSGRDENFESLTTYIEEKLPVETPILFGLHANSEIGYLSNYADGLFKTVLQLEGSSGGGSASGQADVVKSTLQSLLERVPENFMMIEVEERAAPLLKTESSPFVVVALQECTRMNALLTEIRRSLTELEKGLNGQLNISEPMEDLASALSIDQVPGRNPFHKTSWEKLAWPSQKSLATWFLDLLKRVEQLKSWSADLQLPHSIWLGGLFNPTALLTAVMQVTARQKDLPLDNMAIETHVTTMRGPEDVTAYPEDGCLVHGLYIEGARWEATDEHGDPVDAYEVGGVQCAGFLADSRLKELLPPMPVMLIRAVPVQPQWLPTDVGYLRQDPTLFDCPVYITKFRGPTYTCLATLKTKAPVSKWTLAGVALVLQADE